MSEHTDKERMDFLRSRLWCFDIDRVTISMHSKEYNNDAPDELDKLIDGFIEKESLTGYNT